MGRNPLGAFVDIKKYLDLQLEVKVGRPWGETQHILVELVYANILIFECMCYHSVMYEALFRQQEDIFKVIANQKRLEIVQLLTHGELSVSEMVSMLGISQSNVSQHLGLLRQAKIVETRKVGTTVYYSLGNPKIAEACSLIRKFLLERDGAEPTEIIKDSVNSLYPVVQDVVCKMRMAVSEASETLEYDGETYFFCASGCKETFEKAPATYHKLIKAVA